MGGEKPSYRSKETFRTLLIAALAGLTGCKSGRGQADLNQLGNYVLMAIGLRK
jgi:hypothetical protein